MKTIESRVESLIKRHQSGLLTESETVNAFLIDVADLECASEIRELLRTLPSNVEHAVRQRLKSLQSEGFCWRPFLIGEGLDDTQLQRLRRQLETMHVTLSDCN